MQVLSIAKVAYNFLSILLIPTTSSVFAFFSAYSFYPLLLELNLYLGFWMVESSQIHLFNDYKLYSSMILWFKLDFYSV